MAAFEPRSSGEGIDLSANCATTTLRFICQSKTIEIKTRREDGQDQCY